MDNPSILLEIASRLAEEGDTDTKTQLLKALRGVSTNAYSTLNPIYWDHVNPKLKIGPNYTLPSEFSMDLIRIYRHLVLPKLSQLNTGSASFSELNLIHQRILPQIRQVTVSFRSHGKPLRTKRQKALEKAKEQELFQLLQKMHNLKVLTLRAYRDKEEDFGFQQAFEAMVSSNAKIEIVGGFFSDKLELGSTDEQKLKRLMDQLTPWKSRIILNLKNCCISSEIEYNMVKKLSEFCELKMYRLFLSMDNRLDLDWGNWDDRFRGFDFNGFDDLLLKLMKLPKELSIFCYSFDNFEVERKFLPNVPDGKVFANITSLSLADFGTTLDFLHLFPKLETLELEWSPVATLLNYDEDNEVESLNNIRRIFTREPKLKYLYIGGESYNLDGMDEMYALLEELVEEFDLHNFGD